MPAPPSTETVRARLAALLPELRERYAVRSLSVFGSYARGEQTAESDLDLLIEFDEAPGMFAFVGLAHELEDRLGLRVDLAAWPMLKSRTVPHVERDLAPV